MEAHYTFGRPSLGGIAIRDVNEVAEQCDAAVGLVIGRAPPGNRLRAPHTVLVVAQFRLEGAVEYPGAVQRVLHQVAGLLLRRIGGNGVAAEQFSLQTEAPQLIARRHQNLRCSGCQSAEPQIRRIRNSLLVITAVVVGIAGGVGDADAVSHRIHHQLHNVSRTYGHLLGYRKEEGDLRRIAAAQVATGIGDKVETILQVPLLRYRHHLAVHGIPAELYFQPVTHASATGVRQLQGHSQKVFLSRHKTLSHRSKSLHIETICRMQLRLIDLISTGGKWQQ